MSTQPREVMAVLCAFSTLFSASVWQNALILAVGAILCTRKRTVTSSLRAMGLKDEKRFTNFHRVLNRAKWDGLQATRILIGLLVRMLPDCAPLIIVVDETIERRKGRKIDAKGCYRDAVRSTKKHVVHCYGLKWISMTLIAPLPWARRPWALPFLTVLAPSKSSNEAAGKRHKTTVDWTRQMIMFIRRQLPYRTIILVGDGAYAAVSLALCCSGLCPSVALVSRLRMDAGLYDFPPPAVSGKRGPKPKKGKKQPTLQDRVQDSETQWASIEIRWYDGVMRTLDIISGVCLWYTPGLDPVPIKWVVVRDPKGELRTEAFFCTDVEAAERQILQWFILRWNIEVTFEELRAHLGFETQRQWSDTAIARTTPCLFGLFSVVNLIAVNITKGKDMPILSCAWYRKPEATFSDVIALVRRHIWTSRFFVKSSQSGNFIHFEHESIKNIIESICYAA